MTTLIADVEADGLLFDITKIHQISLINVDREETVESYNDHTSSFDNLLLCGSVAQGLKRMSEADTLVMHNGIGYDLPAIFQVSGLVLDWKKIVDTLVLSRLGNPPREGGHSLASWATRIMGYKAKVEIEDWSEWTPEIEKRCGVDVQITLGVWKRLKGMYKTQPQSVALEHAIAEEVRKTIARGFKLDLPHTRKLLNELQTEQEEQLRDFKIIFPDILVSTKPSQPEKVLKIINKNHPLKGVLEPGSPFCPLKVEEFNPGSEPQIARRLIRKYGWRPSQFTPTGMPSVTEEILRELPYPEAIQIADYLHTHKMVEQINSAPKSNGQGGGWLHHVHEDGLVHPFLNPCKAVTGRLSCSAPNLQQVHKDPRMRRAWIPREGYVLLGNDAKGLELRCLGHYLARYDGGAYSTRLVEGREEDGTDVHTVAMGLIGFYDRDETKRAEYGWLYGAGDAKLGSITMRDAQRAGKEINYGHLNISTRLGRRPSAGTVGKAVRRSLEEGIEGLKFLSTDVKEKSKRYGRLRGIDGRTIWAAHPHAALNYLLQSAGAILIKQAWALVPYMLCDEGLVEGEDYACVMQVHDEFQYEVRPDLVDVVGSTISDAIQRAGEILKFRCPLTGNYKSGLSWAETH